jgi:TPR repeat protein
MNISVVVLFTVLTVPFLTAQSPSTPTQSPGLSTQSISDLRQRADKGDIEAMVDLGTCYEEGSEVPQDYTKAAEWWRKAADKGNAAAQLGLAVLYGIGRGVPQNYAMAAVLYRKSAEQGDVEAQTRLAGLYYEGDGVPQDHKQATFWYQKAAEKGNPEAQFYLGLSYDSGLGVPHDSAQAVAWYLKAADQSYAGAQFALGMSYAGGKGVPQDYVEAYFWFDLATAGHFDTVEQSNAAKKMRDDIAAVLTKTDLSRAQQQARKWFELHPQDPKNTPQTEAQTQAEPKTVDSRTTIVCDESRVCTHKFLNGVYYKVISANGLVIAAGGWANDAVGGLVRGVRYKSALVSLTNNSTTPIDVLPADFIVGVNQPKERTLKYLPPMKIAKAETHIDSALSIMKTALRANTISPGESVSGYVYFEGDKKAKDFHLQIPIAGITYDFPF